MKDDFRDFLNNSSNKLDDVTSCLSCNSQWNNKHIIKRFSKQEIYKYIKLGYSVTHDNKCKITALHTCPTCNPLN